ncbi:MAG: hypothetical protein H3C68_03525 [Deltaproteobacteria bacterium]|nr:hypothetical protein [Deltaproteobacteria bacterium]MBZ0219795.1 hypothetical protein [Deltaproteobacteria bacterium]
MLFWREKSYNRERCLAAAAKAQAGGRLKRAVGHYKRVLEADPDDYLVHAKVAPLLARMKNFEEAWMSFKIAGSRYLAAGFSQKAISMYSQAARFMPRNAEVWETMAYVYERQGKRAEAMHTLFSGHRFFRNGPERGKAVSMLRKAFELDPWNFEVTMELSKLLRKTDPVEAMGLMEGLSTRVRGRELRKVRSAMFLAQPGLSTAWRWIKAVWPGSM